MFIQCLTVIANLRTDTVSNKRDYDGNLRSDKYRKKSYTYLNLFLFSIIKFLTNKIVDFLPIFTEEEEKKDEIYNSQLINLYFVQTTKNIAKKTNRKKNKKKKQL